MKLLLDTHIWLWSLGNHPRLGRRLAIILESAGHERWLSAISLWELGTLQRKQRIASRGGPLRTWIELGIEASGVREAPITREIALVASELPWSHRDPADRFLVATAQVMDLTLATADERILALRGVKLIANR